MPFGRLNNRETFKHLSMEWYLWPGTGETPTWYITEGPGLYQDNFWSRYKQPIVGIYSPYGTNTGEPNVQLSI